MLSEPPLAGREAELEKLESELKRVIEGSGCLFLIAGEAGIGKTRLAKEFEKRASTQGCKVLVGNCVPSTQIPYLAFLEALKGLSAEDAGGLSRAGRLKDAAKRSAPDLVGAIPVIGGTAHALAKLLKEYRGDDGDSDQENLLFGTLEVMRTESAKTPLIVHLDDLQWADSASIGMLHFLARNVHEMRIFLLGTYRTEEVLDQEKGVHPFLDSLQVMRREGIVKEVDLHPLAETEVQKVISGMMQRPVASQVIQLVFKESGGSPLFAVETLRMLMSEGRLVVKDGTWTMTGDGATHVPRTIQEVITRRMDRLSQNQRMILECASVIGERFDPSLIHESIGMDELHLLNELDALSKNFQLVAWDDGNYKFAHAKIKDVTYDSISKPKRVELHKRIGNSLEERLPDNSLLGALSWHFDQAQVKNKCIKYSLLAGKYCLKRKAVSEAKMFFQRALDMTKGESNHVLEQLEALEGLGDSEIYQGSARIAYSLYGRFLEMNMDKKARARVLAKAGECLGSGPLQDMKRANEMLDEAEKLSEGDAVILAYIEQERGDLSSDQDKMSEAEAHYAKSQNYYSKLNDSITEIRQRNLKVGQLTKEDRWNEAKTLSEELLPIALKTEDAEVISDVEFWYAEINADMGETELAKEYATRVIERSSKLGLMLNWRFGLRTRAIAYEIAGDLESARNDLIVGLDLSKKFENIFLVAWFEINLGRCELQMGLIDSAKSHFKEGERNISYLPGPHSFQGVYTERTFLKADLLAANGDFEKSDMAYDGLIGTSGEIVHYKLYWLATCHARYGMSLARRNMKEKARDQFDEAMMIARKIGSEKMVQLLAKRVGMVLD